MAVFTPVSLEEAKAYLSAYEIGALLGFEGIEEGVSNTNFRVETEAGLFALTLFEAVTPEADLPFFMDYTAYLDRRGFPAPGPVAMRDGAYLGRLNGRPTALIKWLKGRWPREVGESEAQTAGGWLARLHVEGQGFGGRRANSMGMPSMKRLLGRCTALTEALPRAAEMRDDLETEVKALIKNWPSHLPAGIIHADYFIDNVLMDEFGQMTGVIDYYYACHDVLAYDLAIGLNAWGFTPGGQVRPEVMAAFRDGYEAVRPLTPGEAAALPLLNRAAAVRFATVRLHDLLHHNPDWLVKPKDPEAFYRRLIFHRG